MAFNPPSLATKYLNRLNGRMGPPPGGGLLGSISPAAKEKEIYYKWHRKRIRTFGKNSSLFLSLKNSTSLKRSTIIKPSEYHFLGIEIAPYA